MSASSTSSSVPPADVARHGALQRYAPFARLAMGLVFVVAGIAKAVDPIHFYWELVSYAELMEVNREAWHRIASSGLIVGPLECAVGLALLFNWKPRITLPTATALMTAFTALTLYAWGHDANLDCGCFGALVERSPGEAALEDGIMLLVLLVAWRWGTGRLPTAYARAPRMVAIGTVIALLVTGARFYPEAERVRSSDLKVGMRLRGLKLKGPELDLSEGEYLVEIFSPQCSRCLRSIPKLNRWAQIDDLPPVVALNVFAQDSPALAEFKRTMKPAFSVAPISTSDFRRLTAGHGYPRLAYVRDGVIHTVWEHFEFPTTAQLKRVAGSGGEREESEEG